MAATRSRSNGVRRVHSARGSNSHGSSNASLALWLSLAALWLMLDQFTKYLIVATYGLGDGTVVTGFFNVVRVHNYGAAFSFLSHAGGWQRWLFMGIGVGAAAFIVWMLRTHPHQKLFSFAMASLLGGAIGNVLDRVWHGYVVDFIDFHWRWLSPLFVGGHFPAFNVADTAITIGAICLILDELFRVRSSSR